MKKVFVVCMALCSIQAFTQISPLTIIPVPVKMEVTGNRFTLSPATVLLVKDKGHASSAAFLNDYLQKFYGFSLKKVSSAKKNYRIRYLILK